MSFILDALKKSEIERQRQSNPGLVDPGIARPRPRLPAWAIALGILLTVNLLVLSVVLTQGGWMTSHALLGPTPAQMQPQARSNPAAAPAAPARNTPPDDRSQSGDTAQAISAAAAPTVTNRHFSPLDAESEYAPEIPLTAASTPASIPKPAGDDTATHAAHRPDPALTDDDYKAADEEILPTINEINLAGAQALPELHLDVHVFATRPAERFVYINMRKYHEGATLQEGPTIERIRRDGVILDYQSLRFLLPRQ